jgi:hypothetical protein
VRIDPQYPAARNNLVIALGRVGRLPDAIAQLQIAVRLIPTPIWVPPWLRLDVYPKPRPI